MTLIYVGHYHTAIALKGKCCTKYLINTASLRPSRKPVFTTINSRIGVGIE